MLPIAGCALGTGVIFAAFMRSVAYSPEIEGEIFIYAILGFALIETFAFILIGTAGFIYAF